MLIDFHTHLAPEPLLQQRLEEWERRVGKPRYAGSLEDLLPRLRDGGADRFCVMPFATGPGQARELTRWCADLARMEPRVVPMATFHPADRDLRLQVKEAFDDLGLSGAELHCQWGQFYPDDRHLFPLYERAVADGLPVVFHASRKPLPSRYVGSEPFYQMMRRFPGLRAVVAHLGADEMETFFDLAMMFDELYLDTSLAFCEQPGFQPRLERVIEFQDRIVYASGFPESACDLRRGLDAITQLGLGPGIEAKLFATNAARLLGLDLAAI